MNLKRYLVTIALLFSGLIIKAQNPFYHQTFEGNDNTAPEIAVIDKDGGNSWQIYGIITPASITQGYGHSSFNVAGVNCNGSTDDWMIMPKLKVRKDYIFSFWAQAFNPSITEQFHLVASKSSDSSITEDYTIKLEDVTVNSSSNYDEWNYPVNGTRGQWKLYQYKLENISGLSIGDNIFIAFHTDNPSNNSLVIDDILYDSYCPGNISWGADFIDDAFGSGSPRIALSFNIFTTALNEIYGPKTSGMTGNLGTDAFPDSYFYYHRGYNYGIASLCQNQVYGLSVLAIHYKDALYNLQNTRVSAWIDFNGNNVFDASEKVIDQQKVPGNFAYGFAVVGYFQVPSNVPLGNTRIRIRMYYDVDINMADPCADGEYGQTYDYEAIILPPIPKPSPDAFIIPSKPPKQTVNPSQYITNVKILPDLDNPSGYLGFSSTTAGTTTWYGYNYSNFTWLVPPDLTAGSSQTLTVTAKANSCTLGAWIDFNHDGNFNETDVASGGERVMLRQTASNTYSATFTVPNTVIDKQEVLLRVRVGSYSWGNTMTSIVDLGQNSETEDYRVRFLSSIPITIPACASNPFPANGATNVDVNPTLSWDQVTDAVTYDVYFGTDNPPTTLVSAAQVANRYTPVGPLQKGTTYYWKVVPKNTGGSAVGCSVWSFTTPGVAVNCTSYIAPVDNAVNVAVNTSISWNAVAEATKYDVYFGTDNPPATKVSADQTATFYTPPSNLLTGTVYYWKIVPKNASGSATGCTVWKFTTIIPVPSCATNPVPADLTTGLTNLYPTLQWNVVSDATKYDVYFGTSNPPTTLVSADQTGNSYAPAGPLVKGTTYYWKVIPKNAGGSSTGCAVWRFTMINPCVPPSVTAKANNTATVYANCPRSMPLYFNLTANPSGGSGCTGNWVYSWSNGSKFWNGVGFISATPVYNSAYTTVSTSASDSTSYFLTVQCDNDLTCSSQSSVVTVPLKSPATIAAAIGSPANGLQHYMHVTWSKVNGVKYRLEFSADKKTWTNTSFDGIKTYFDFNTGDYPNDSTFFRVKSYLGVDACDFTTMPTPVFTACDYPNLSLSNPKGTSIDFSLLNEVPVANPDYTLYSIKCQSCGASTQYLQANGTLGSSEVFLTKSVWNAVKTISNLSALTQYCFYATAKNMDGDLRTEGPAKTVCLSTSNCTLTINSQTTSPQTKCAGDNINLSVSVTSNYPVSYQWIKSSGDIAGATNSVYALTNLSKSNEDAYKCKITNSCTSVTSASILLLINLPPTLSVTPVDIHKNAGESVTFSVNPGGAAPFSYQWYKDNVIISGATGDSYNIPSCSQANNGVYSCQVTNSCGQVKSNIATLTVIPAGNNLIYGYVTYDNTVPTVMTLTTVKIRNTENTYSDQITTDAQGYFQFTPPASGKYILTGETTKKWGGGTPTDALIINKVFVSLMTFADAMKKKAADVNKDGKQNATDALIINKRFVSLLSSFTSGDWYFNTDTVSFTSGSLQHDFKAICFGDVDGSYKPPLTKLIPDIYLNNDGIASSDKNGIVELPVRFSEAVELGAIGIILNLNNNDAKIIGVSSDIEDAVYNFNNNFVGFAWSAKQNNLNLKSNDIIFKIKVQLPSSGIAKPLSFSVNPVSVLADPFANELFERTISMPNISSLSSDYNVVAYPNPFSNISNIEYILPSSAKVSLKVFNILGVQIAELVNSEQNAGSYKVEFNGSGLPEGIYLYRFEANNDKTNFNKSDIIILAR